MLAIGKPLLLHGAETVESIGSVVYGRPSTPLSILAVPMVLGGKTIGVLSAQSYEPDV